jgi:predicted transcriptional regulator
MSRRDHSAVLCSLLEAGYNGSTKTGLVYKSNLNFAIVKPYIASLVKAGMLVTDGKHYETTEKGRKFIQSYSRTMEMLVV